jgi:hypothetical protein
VTANQAQQLDTFVNTWIIPSCKGIIPVLVSAALELRANWRGDFMSLLQIAIPGDGPAIDFERFEVWWFAKELICWQHRHKGMAPPDPSVPLVDPPPDQSHIYKAAIHEAEKILKKLDPKCPRIPAKRLRNLIARGFTNLTDDEVEFLRRAVSQLWLPGIPEKSARGMAVRGKATARTKRARKGRKGQLDPSSYAHMLGLSTKVNSQSSLRDLLGYYYIFRRINDRRIMVVSHMVLKQDEQAKLPAHFTTSSHAVGKPYEESSTVKGVAYVPPEQPNAVFTFGKLEDSSQVRSAILERKAKPLAAHQEHHSDDYHTDLVGIRLGLSRPEGPGRQPIGYSIWCSRLESDEPPDGWLIYARQYELVTNGQVRLASTSDFKARHGTDPHSFFSDKVIGFEKIIEWLGRQTVAFSQP